MGQTYFAYQAQHHKLVDLLGSSGLPEDQQRDLLNMMLYTYAFKLKKAAQETSAVEPSDFAIFYDKRYASPRT